MTFNFSSLAEFVKTAADPEAKRLAFGSREQSHNTGGASFADAVALASNGWAEGRAEVEKRRAEFGALLASRVSRPQLINAVAGFAPDVGAFLANSPECMFNRETVEREAPGKIISIRVSSAYRVNVSHEAVLDRGARVCALVDAIESAGFRAELSVAFTSSSRSHSDGVQNRVFIALKSAEEPLEIDKLAFATAHAAMFRRLVFSVREQDAEFFTATGGDYGYSYDDTAEAVDLFLPTLRAGMEDRNALAWFAAQMTALGIDFSAA